MRRRKARGRMYKEEERRRENVGCREEEEEGQRKRIKIIKTKYLLYFSHPLVCLHRGLEIFL